MGQETDPGPAGMLGECSTTELHLQDKADGFLAKYKAKFAHITCKCTCVRVCMCVCGGGVGWSSGMSHYMSPCQFLTAVFSFTVMTL